MNYYCCFEFNELLELLLPPVEIYFLNANLHASETRADMYFEEWEHAHNEGVESSERAAKVLKLARALSESVAQHAKKS